MEVSEKEWNELLKRVERLERQVKGMFNANRAIIPSLYENVNYLLATKAKEQRAIQESHDNRMRQINRLLGGED